MEIKTLDVQGFEAAIAGMRNPLKSYGKADSEQNDGTWEMGDNDLDLAQRLIKAGPEHRKFLRMIWVWADITAPRFWWSEYDTYKVATAANSESTMHKLKDEDISRDLFEFDWGEDPNMDRAFDEWIKSLNQMQDKLNAEEDPAKKKTYHRMLKAMLPESFLQKRTVCINYETIRTMYHQRKTHRLPQWSDVFCEWVESLPYSEFLTGN